VSDRLQSSSSVRYKTARLILWFNAFFLTGATVLSLGLFILKRFYQPGYEPAWINFFSTIALFVSVWVSLYRIRYSLFQGFYLYGWLGLICITIVLFYNVFVEHEVEIPFIVFALHIGIFAAGLILGLRYALIYATVVSVIVTIVGFYCKNTGFAVAAVGLAYGMTLPSWLVDQLERDLRKSEEKFITIFRDALDVILVVDLDTRVILKVNRAVETVLGYESEVLLGQPVSILWLPEGELSSYHFWEDLRTRKAIFESTSFRRADGLLCPVDLTATVIPWEDHNAALVTLRDVTERYYVEEQLRRHQEQLEQQVQDRTGELQTANDQLRIEVLERQRAEETLRDQAVELEARNVELDAFAHTVAHDLKNPLTNLIGFSNLLERRLERLSPDKIASYVQMIGQNGRKMNNIINELLLLASVRKIEEVERDVLDMATIVHEAQDRLRDMLAESQAVVTVPEQWPPAFGYGPWVEEVWANYISNAIKYGGVPPRVELGAERLVDGRVRFWVRDNGKGLTLEERAQLFTLFTRLDKVRARGHGLGLSIVRRIVEKLGGEVGVESEVGQGSCFSFILPAAAVSMAVQPTSTPLLGRQD